MSLILENRIIAKMYFSFTHQTGKTRWSPQAPLLTIGRIIVGVFREAGV